MDLDLSGVDLAPIITCTIENILEPSDLAALASGALTPAEVDEEVQGIIRAARPIDDPANLKKIRERHHSVARLVASGVSQRLVATMTSYTESYISVLLNNPAMQELCELYRVQYGSNAMVIGEKLRTVAMDALEEVGDRLDDPTKRDAMSVQDLVSIGKLGLDRSGHGPTSTQHVVTEDHLIDHARLQELNQQARAESASFIVPRQKVIESLPAPQADAA